MGRVQKPTADAGASAPPGLKGPWVLRCAPGLGRVAVAELRYRRVLARDVNPLFPRQRNHDLIFLQRTLAAPPGPLLRIPEEIHHCLLYGRYKISNTQLERLATQLRAQQRPFHLAVTADGAHFSRHDMRRWLERQLTQLKVRVQPDAKQPLWVFFIDEAYYFCLPRATFADAAFRPARQAERTGALPPTIAAALAFLGEPKPGTTILDPVCGSGTLLAEAYGYVPDAQFIGFDTDPAALQAARQNLAHISRLELRQGDGTQTDLPAASVQLFLANLPFGKQYGDRQTNPQLYAALLAEMLRLGVPGHWRAVLLSSDVAAVEKVLATNPAIGCTKQLKLKVRGEWAQVFVVQPTK